MNELTWDQEQDIQDYNIYLAETQKPVVFRVGDRVEHRQFGHVKGIVKSVYRPCEGAELWVRVLWLARPQASIHGPNTLVKNKMGKIEMSRLRLAR